MGLVFRVLTYITYWASGKDICDGLSSTISASIRGALTSDFEEDDFTSLKDFFKNLVERTLLEYDITSSGRITETLTRIHKCRRSGGALKCLLAADPEWFRFKTAKKQGIYFMIIKIRNVVYSYSQIEIKNIRLFDEKMSLVHICSVQIARSLTSETNKDFLNETAFGDYQSWRCQNHYERGFWQQWNGFCGQRKHLQEFQCNQ